MEQIFNMNLTNYKVVKDDAIIDSGICPTFYIHGIIDSIIYKSNADKVILYYSSGKEMKLISPSLLFKHIPKDVSIENHKKWFTGCKFKLEF